MKLSEKIRQQTGNHKDMPLDAMISLCALDQWADEAELLEAENEGLLKGVKMAHLHLLASVCECGEPLKETDAFDCLDALLADTQE